MERGRPGPGSAEARRRAPSCPQGEECTEHLQNVLSVSPANEHGSAGGKQTVYLQIEEDVGAAGGLLWSTGGMDSLGWILVTVPKATWPRRRGLGVSTSSCAHPPAVLATPWPLGAARPFDTLALHSPVLLAHLLSTSHVPPADSSRRISPRYMGGTEAQ